MSGWNGGGRILVSQSAEELKERKTGRHSADYKKLGSGIFMSLVIYLLGDILGKLPGIQRDRRPGMVHYYRDCN